MSRLHTGQCRLWLQHALQTGAGQRASITLVSTRDKHARASRGRPRPRVRDTHQKPHCPPGWFWVASDSQRSLNLQSIPAGMSDGCPEGPQTDAPGPAWQTQQLHRGRCFLLPWVTKRSEPQHSGRARADRRILGCAGCPAVFVGSRQLPVTCAGGTDCSRDTLGHGDTEAGKSSVLCWAARALTEHGGHLGTQRPLGGQRPQGPRLLSTSLE